ncbi:6-phosphofructokinase [Synoicihabitans lomoniglobus]|uniref:ATP-dependent 6-phosphofructokinase n=1 Tax=Synoicihabitans lomoniglobus TaxID=2909285 RepID=A0AAF0CMZ1_9BACT|nr:6-phosphofructokinase [Opitutaceae bacterium LMO-M01]WED64803.1 ATP-dependent 6-phosphofructokinase [Opitutaceae bacterium LMO-M01]
MANERPGTIGILTAGGDCPGLNAVIRGVAKAAMHYGLRVIGIQDGFRGLVENRFVELDNRMVSGILTQGGTLLGSSRDKPHKMPMGNKVMNMTQVTVDNYHALNLDCLVCLGGNGTAKNAYRLHQQGGINVMVLPKTIDNDVAETDITFGFDSAMGIATEAIDRLHTTATSHHRIIVCEIMGHDAGWLCLGAGIAGGADVILIPEIPYNLDAVARSLLVRQHSGKRFSIIAVAEGIRSVQEVAAAASSVPRKRRDKDKEVVHQAVDGVHLVQEATASRVAREIQQRTGVEARVTSLGHVQRGGPPSAFDRLLCTRLGTMAGHLLAHRKYNVMVGVKGTDCVPVPLGKVAGIKRTVPRDHDWIKTARLVATCLGDEESATVAGAAI